MEVNQQIYPLEAIPKSLHGVELSDHNRLLLSQGQNTELLHGLVLDDKTVVNAKVWLCPDETGELVVNYKVKRDTLFIPNKIGDYELSQEDKLRLENGEVLTATINKTPMTIHVDRELNAIVVRGPGKDVSQVIAEKFERTGKFEISGYTLTPEEVRTLTSGKELPTKLFEENGSFFTAKVSVTGDRTGLSYRDVLEIPKNKVEELRARLNVAPSVLESVALSGEKAMDVNKQDVSIIQGTSSKPTQVLENVTESSAKVMNPDKVLNQDKAQNLVGDFKKAVENRDFSQIEVLANKGYVANKGDIEFLEKTNAITNDEKVGLAQSHPAMFGIRVEKSPDLSTPSPEFREAVDKADYSALKKLENTSYVLTSEDIAYFKATDKLDPVQKNKLMDYHSELFLPLLSQYYNPLEEKVSVNLGEVDPRVKEFYAAVDSRDFVKLDQLSQSGLVLATDEVKHLNSAPNLSDIEKEAIKAVLNVQELPNEKAASMETTGQQNLASVTASAGQAMDDPRVKEFFAAVAAKDFVKIDELAQSGLKLTPLQEDMLAKSPNLKPEEKANIQNIMKVEGPAAEKVPGVASKEEDLTNVKRQPAEEKEKSANGNQVGHVVKEMFTGM